MKFRIDSISKKLSIFLITLLVIGCDQSDHSHKSKKNVPEPLPETCEAPPPPYYNLTDYSLTIELENNEDFDVKGPIEISFNSFDETKEDITFRLEQYVIAKYSSIDVDNNLQSTIKFKIILSNISDQILRLSKEDGLVLVKLIGNPSDLSKSYIFKTEDIYWIKEEICGNYPLKGLVTTGFITEL